jgi:hypothetical protein
MTATRGSLEAHVCAWCDMVSLSWVRWQNDRGWQHYFCDNDCLAQWIARGVVNVAREIQLECLALRTPCGGACWGRPAEETPNA